MDIEHNPVRRASSEVVIAIAWTSMLPRLAPITPI